MTQIHDSMMYPQIEELLERVPSKFKLVTLAAARARQINSYFTQLGHRSDRDALPGGDSVERGAPIAQERRRAIPATIPPQVTSVARKPLSIAFEEIAADKIQAVELEPRLDTTEPADEAGVADAGPAEAE